MSQKQVEYRDLPMPSRVQMQSVVKGDDRYIKRKPFPWIALLAVIIPIVYGVYRILIN